MANKDVSTLDLLKRIELKMEMLTQTLERLPEEKVKIAQSKTYFHKTTLQIFRLGTFTVYQSFQNMD